MSSLAAEGLQTVNRLFMRLSGGRAWWAHFEFTRINIEPIILRKKIEELRILRVIAWSKGSTVSSSCKVPRLRDPAVSTSARAACASRV